MKIKGYYSGALAAKLNAAIKTALTKFQQDNTLPIGSVDLETVSTGNYKVIFVLFKLKAVLYIGVAFFIYQHTINYLRISKLLNYNLLT